MDIKLVQSLVRIMLRADLTEMEIEDSGVRIHFRRGGEGGGAAPLVHVMQGGGSAPQQAFGDALGGSVPGSGEASGEPPAGEFPPGTKPFPSPMVGTFYRSSSPDSEPFVKPGSSVDEETVLCIIEAMKVMNEIKAEMRFEIVKVLVENGEPVEFGQPLFLFKSN
jgi:acetyl-CoA carboxylase biotin carboxyl carrier protein